MTRQKKICLRLQGGFCNRVRSIVSGMLWAKDIGASLELFWPVEKGHMPCSLEQLIDPSSIAGLTYVHPLYLNGAKQILSHADMHVAASLSEYEIRVQSYSIFHDDLENATARGLAALRSIRIVPELEEQVSIHQGILIGVHVRRTDHVKCIAASPVAAFERAIEDELALNKDARFCLVTDDLAVKMRFQNLYGEAIYSPTTVLGRMTAQQQFAGVIDWLLLHRCSKILASAGSSFSELAALRAGIELVPVMPSSLGTAAVLGTSTTA
jgi:hypothetical protein